MQITIAETVLAETGITLAWYDVLLELFRENPQTMSQLGERVVLSRSRVSRVVDQLEAAGLVSREPNPDDRRSSFAAITADGRATFTKVAKVYTRAIDHELQHVDPAVLRRIADDLATVRGIRTAVAR